MVTTKTAIGRAVLLLLGLHIASTSLVVVAAATGELNATGATAAMLATLVTFVGSACVAVLS